MEPDNIVNKAIDKFTRYDKFLNSVTYLEMDYFLEPVSPKQRPSIIDLIEEEGLIKRIAKDEFTFTALYFKVKNLGGWFAYLKLKEQAEESEEAERDLERHIKRLTHEQLVLEIEKLKTDIRLGHIQLFQARHWVIIGLATAGLSALFSWLFSRL